MGMLIRKRKILTGIFVFGMIVVLISGCSGFKTKKLSQRSKAPGIQKKIF